MPSLAMSNPTAVFLVRLIIGQESCLPHNQYLKCFRIVQSGGRCPLRLDDTSHFGSSDFEEQTFLDHTPFSQDDPKKKVPFLKDQNDDDSDKSVHSHWQRPADDTMDTQISRYGPQEKVAHDRFFNISNPSSLSYFSIDLW